jgi:hypothetical protein
VQKAFFQSAKIALYNNKLLLNVIRENLFFSFILKQSISLVISVEIKNLLRYN